MIIEELKQFTPVNGVIKISDVDESFEKVYHRIRKLEKRNYSDEEVRLLPFSSRLNPHREEWNFRARSFLRFKKYLSQKKSGLNILDLGCGNGWFAGKILSEQNHNFYCVDINLNDLTQGARIFSSENLKFIYADLFAVKFPRSSFDLVIMNSSIQYFPDLKILMRELFYLLNSYGEIHILDSLFYDDEEIVFAKNKSDRYFELLGFPQMKGKIFQHSYRTLNKFNHNFLYDPRTFTNKLLRAAFGKDTPYPWIVIKR
jgi:ubiquinone/menaquinone biosynthesis C-methylase UbiE